jgi:hypothetical protein
MNDREEKVRLISKRMKDIESLWRTIENETEQDTTQQQQQQQQQQHAESSWNDVSLEPLQTIDLHEGSNTSGSFTSDETTSEGHTHRPFHSRQSLWRIWRPRSETNRNSNEDDDHDNDDHDNASDHEAEIMRDTKLMIAQKFPDLKHNPSIIEDDFGEEDYYKALPEDTFSLMILGEPFSKQWIYGMIAFGLQTSLLFVIAAEFYVSSKESTPLNVPYKVDPAVLFGQILALLLSLLTQVDLILAISTFMLLGYKKKENWTSLIKAPLSSTFSTWVLRIAFPVSCEFFEGFLVLATTFCIVVQSDSILELFKNFAAMQLVSHIDNVAFWLALNGYIGFDLMVKAKQTRRIKVHEDTIQLSCGIPLRTLVILVLMLIMCAGWSYFLVGQISGKFFFMTYPYCRIPMSSIQLMNDGFCDGGILNTIDCGFEDGDCISKSDIHNVMTIHLFVFPMLTFFPRT